MEQKKGIPIDTKALAIGLFIAIIISFQQIAIILLERFFLNYLSLFESKLIAYGLSIFILVYYLNKTIKNHKK